MIDPKYRIVAFHAITPRFDLSCIDTNVTNFFSF